MTRYIKVRPSEVRPGWDVKIVQKFRGGLTRTDEGKVDSVHLDKIDGEDYKLVKFVGIPLEIPSVALMDAWLDTKVYRALPDLPTAVGSVIYTDAGPLMRTNTDWIATDSAGIEDDDPLLFTATIAFDAGKGA